MSMGSTQTTTIKWNHKGFEQILCSPGAKSYCERIAAQAADAANVAYVAQIASTVADGGPDISYRKIAKGKVGYEAKKAGTVYMYGSKRACARVVSNDKEAAAAESEYKILTMAVIASGG